MHDTKLCFLTALEIAKKIHKGEISAVETLEAHLTQIERINPQVNAIVTFIPELALEEARKADGKSGKRWKHRTASWIAHCSQGSGTYQRYSHHLRLSGFFRISFQRKMHCSWNVYGKEVRLCLAKRILQNLELVLRPSNRVFGVTRNPYDLSKTCG